MVSMVDRLGTGQDFGPVWSECELCGERATMLPCAAVCKRCDPVLYDWSADAALERDRRGNR